GLTFLGPCLVASWPPTKPSATSTVPRSLPSGLSGPPHASRRRPRTNHADFCVIPISLASCKLEMPLRAVTSRYIEYSHLCSGTLERSITVPVRTVKSNAQDRQR